MEALTAALEAAEPIRDVVGVDIVLAQEKLRRWTVRQREAGERCLWREEGG